MDVLSVPLCSTVFLNHLISTFTARAHTARRLTRLSVCQSFVDWSSDHAHGPNDPAWAPLVRDLGEALSTAREVVVAGRWVEVGLVRSLGLNTMGRKTRSDTVMSFLADLVVEEANLARVCKLPSSSGRMRGARRSGLLRGKWLRS